MDPLSNAGIERLATLSGVASPPHRGRWIVSLRVKFLAFVSIAFLATGFAFGTVFSRQQASAMRLEFQKRGEVLARSLAANSRLPVWSGDRETTSRLVGGMLEQPDVLGAAVYDPKGTLLSSSGEAPAKSASPPNDVEVEPATSQGGQDVLAFRAPVVLQPPRAPRGELLELQGEPRPQVVGTAVVLLGFGGIDQTIARARHVTLVVTAVIVGCGILSVMLLSRIFVTPIEDIAAAARRIALGDRRSRVRVRSHDELGELAEAFNGMTEALGAREEDLRQMNVGLEHKVKARTAELEQKSTELLTANVELERASRLKSEFLANMSHELRTPLNAVNGFSELLLEGIHGPLTPKQRRYVDNILTSGRHLLQLINDILDLSKIEAGRMEVHPETFSLRHTIENAASVIQPLAQRKGVAIELDIAGGLEEIQLDPGKTRQILYNLMSNAVKFTDKGKVTVSAAAVPPDGLEVVVADTGIGIAPEDQARIFREFEQVDGSHSRRYEGTGLGLALTRKLVELQGGTIRVESELGKGTRFIVRLPRERRATGSSAVA